MVHRFYREKKSGVHVRQMYLNTLFIHCDAHQLNFLLLHETKTI